jgi:hypothetical protein
VFGAPTHLVKRVVSWFGLNGSLVKRVVPGDPFCQPYGSVYCENTKVSYLCHSRVVEYPTKPSVRVAIIAIGMFIWIGVFSFLFY